MHPHIAELLRFLEEDLGFEDITTASVLREDVEALAEVVTKESGVIAGVEDAKALIEHFNLSCRALKRDGEEVDRGEVVLEIEGSARAILMLERVVLNLLMRMSGIATLTRRMQEIAQRYGVRIAGTRKTTPGFRYFEKRAIAIGGGDTHRLRLDDCVLIKDNHLALVGMEEAIRRAKEASFTKKVEVEVGSVAEAIAALEAGADIVMLDNFRQEDVEQVMLLVNQRGYSAMIEVSGGITPENLESYARLRPDVISTGCITTQAAWLDISMRLRKL
ncbi:carboxylating nicotinate-nucleotide diphosphorylase [Candidatus Pyrohabitans sp.]